MGIKIYLPYNQYDDEDFDSDMNMSNDEFFSRLEREEQMSKNTAIDFFNQDRSRYKNAASFNAAVAHKDARVRYSVASATISNAEENDMSVDDIVSECVKQTVGAVILDFDYDNMDEEFESDLKQWSNEHDSINEYVDKLGEDWVFANEPSKNFRIMYLNKVGEEKYADIVNCRIIEKRGMSTYVIVYDKMTFNTEK